MKLKYLFVLSYSILLAYCSPPSQKAEQAETITTSENPPAPGFNAEASDSLAIQLADAVMRAQGGRDAWDQSRYFYWTFFGRRSLLWDKKEKRVRIDIPDDSVVIITHLHDNTGMVSKQGKMLEQPDSLDFYLQQGKSIWINDAYWLFMPFKLKDSGVTLSYLGEDITEAGEHAHVLELQFKGVGDTPDNKYEVFVSQQDSLVKQWAFYRTYKDSVPLFTTPWSDYQPYGQLLLSGKRGKGELTNIAVLDQVPDQLFNSLEPYDPEILK
jgi:hypothetical protein